MGRLKTGNSDAESAHAKDIAVTQRAGEKKAAEAASGLNKTAITPIYRPRIKHKSGFTAEYHPDDVEKIRLVEEQKAATEIATQTESIYTRNKEVWKTTNQDILEQHLIKEGLPFTKESADAAHARYVKEIQEADEAKAKAEAAFAAKKAAETTSTLPGTLQGTPTTAVDPETQRLLELIPHMPEIIVDMWNASMMRHGWQFVDSTIKTKYNVALSTLAKEVYSTFAESKGSDEALRQLIQEHVPRQTVTQNPTGTLPGTMQPPPGATQTPPGTITGTINASIITPTSPNSSTNLAPQPNIVAGRVPDMVQDLAKLAENAVQTLFERNWKLSDEEVDNFRSKLGIGGQCGGRSTKSPKHG